MRQIAGAAVLALSLVQVLSLSMTADEIEAERSGWNVDPETQYHIQTDEGPERYFRFQTLNGQYRKEKRLQDGTVVGTEGWLDPLGYLRIKDYIADTKGFRILKSKMIFVGKNRPIQDAVSLSRNVPATSGVLTKPHRPVNHYRRPELKDVSSNSIESNGIAATTSRSSLSTPVASTTTRTTTTITPLRLRPIVVTTSSRPRPFHLAPLKPSLNEANNPNSHATGYKSPYRGYQALAKKKIQPPSLIAEPPLLEFDQNHLASSQSSAKIRLVVPSPAPFRGYMRYNGTTLRDDTSRPQYDGIHNSGRNGFRYYLKKQYHEEQRVDDKKQQESDGNDTKKGSFGYVDPFGIRRVIYYKADAKDGFVHRKNNRYVGHDAKPYDPSPIAERLMMH